MTKQQPQLPKLQYKKGVGGYEGQFKFNSTSVPLTISMKKNDSKLKEVSKHLESIFSD